MLKDDGGQHQHHKGAGQPTGLFPQFGGKLYPQVRSVFAQAGNRLRQTGIQVILDHGERTAETLARLILWGPDQAMAGRPRPLRLTGLAVMGSARLGGHRFPKACRASALRVARQS
jgi:hypothetical protein